MAEVKSYICTKNPRHRIGAGVRFKDGWFTTASKFLQDKVESNGWFGCHIIEVPAEYVDQDGPEAGGDVDLDTDIDFAEPPMPAGDTDQATEPDEQPQSNSAAIVPLGEVRPEMTLADAIAATRDAEDAIEPTPEPEEEDDPELADPAWNDLSATDIIRMKVADLRALATELGIDQEEMKTGAVRREVRLKLGV